MNIIIIIIMYIFRIKSYFDNKIIVSWKIRKNVACGSIKLQSKPSTTCWWGGVQPLTACTCVEYVHVEVGAGLSGSVLAHLHAVLLQKSSVIVEKREHLGGNLFD